MRGTMHDMCARPTLPASASLESAALATFKCFCTKPGRACVHASVAAACCCVCVCVQSACAAHK